MRYPALTLFAIAFGVEEAIIVLYLRSFAPSGTAHAAAIVAPFMPPGDYALEMTRELSTIAILVAIAWLAASNASERVRAFLFAFGTWDIVYYIALWLLSGYPTITSYDVLFLVPVPWVAPVWAPMAFAAALVLIGIFGIAERRSGLLGIGLALGLISFVYQPVAALAAGHTTLRPGDIHAYPVWLFLMALTCVLCALRPGTLRVRQLAR
jgi:hypothetical protein